MRLLSAAVSTNEVTTGMALAAASSALTSRTPCAKQNMATSGVKCAPATSASGSRRITEGSKKRLKSDDASVAAAAAVLARARAAVRAAGPRRAPAAPRAAPREPEGFDDEDDDVDLSALEGLTNVEVVSAGYEDAGDADFDFGQGSEDLLKGVDPDMPLDELLSVLCGEMEEDGSLATSVGEEADEEAQAQALRKSLEAEGLSENLVELRRVTKVTKGGSILAFRALVVLGDKNGRVGVGVGKGKEVIIATAKAVTDAKKSIISVPLTKTKSLPHKIVGRATASRVVLRPATEGTGVTAGGATKVVLEMAGVSNVLTKQLGSASLLNNARATLDGLSRLKSPAQVAEDRGISIKQVFGIDNQLVSDSYGVESVALSEGDFEAELAKLDKKCRDKLVADVEWLKKHNRPVQPTIMRRAPKEETASV